MASANREIVIVRHGINGYSPGRIIQTDEASAVKFFRYQIALPYHGGDAAAIALTFSAKYGATPHLPFPQVGEQLVEHLRIWEAIGREFAGCETMPDGSLSPTSTAWAERFNDVNVPRYGTVTK